MNNPWTVYQSNFVLQRCFFSHSFMYPTAHHAPPEEAYRLYNLLCSVRLGVGWGTMKRKKISNKPIWIFKKLLSNSGVGSLHELSHVFLITDSYVAQEALKEPGNSKVNWPLQYINKWQIWHLNLGLPRLCSCLQLCTAITIVLVTGGLVGAPTWLA